MFAGTILGLTACNNYNDQFDGIDDMREITDVANYTYELVGSDYDKIAADETNKALAEANGVSQELELVKSLKRFNDLINPEEYLPAFLNGKYYQGSVGSTAKITVAQTTNLPAYMQTLADIADYKISAEDYTLVWGEKVQASYLSPSTEKEISKILENAFSDAQDGKTILVNYNYSALEPSIGGSGSTETPTAYYKKVTTFTGEGKYLLVGQGTSYAMGMLADESKTYGYPPQAEISFSKGNIGSDANSDACALTLSPSSTGYTLLNARGQYLSQSGAFNSLNFTTEMPESGAVWTINQQADGSFFITNTSTQKTLFFSPAFTSFGSYATQGTNLTLELYKLESAAKPIQKAAVKIGYNKSSIWMFNGSKWVPYTTDEARVTTLDPAVYESIESSFINNPTEVLPLYLSRTYPYAQDKDKIGIVYYSAVGKISTKEYQLKNNIWTENTNVQNATYIFMKESSKWVVSKAYLNESALSDNMPEGFIIQNVLLSGSLTYVWSVSAQYGFKGTAFANKLNNPAESWVVSRAIDLKKAKSPVLTLDHVSRYYKEPKAALTLQVSTDYNGDVTKCTWTQVEIPEWSSGADWNFIPSGAIDLSHYNGKTIYIALKYTSTAEEAGTWEVKNLLIEEAK